MNLRGLRLAFVNSLTALIFFLLAYVNFHQFLIKGGHLRISHLFLIAQLTISALLFIARQPPAEVSRKLMDVTMALLGTYAPFLFSLDPTNGRFEIPGLILQAAGIFLSIYSLICLGRAMGILPANRGIRTRGIYRIVRHPIYASYQISTAGYLIGHPTRLNLLIALLCFLGQLYRLLAEERLLDSDQEYRAYRKQVRWRLIPYVF